MVGATMFRGAGRGGLTALDQRSGRTMLPIEGDGWFVDTPTGQLGPITSAALERLVSTGEVRLATLVWHESLEDWTTLQSIFAMDPSWDGPAAELAPVGAPYGGRASESQPVFGPGPTAFCARRVKVTNSLHLLWALTGALVAVLASVALINAGEAWVLAALLMLVFMYLAFWTLIEVLGMTIEDRVLKYPVRLKYWPHIFPIGRRAIPVDRIRRVTAISRASHVHFLQLTTDEGERDLIFDDLFMREVFLLAIIARTTPRARN
jgi:GYF domain 2